MARKAYTPPPVIARPPLTPDDAARVAGTLKHGDGRPDFLRKTVDMIDRSDCDAESRLRRFIQDWQHHARAKMLVELGDTLAWLVEGVGPDVEALEEAEKRAGVVDDILNKVPGFDKLEDLNPEYLADVMTFVHALGEEYGTETDTAGVKALRKKLIDDRPAEGESVDEVRAELKACEDEKRKIETDRDELMGQVETLSRANTLLREEVRHLNAQSNDIRAFMERTEKAEEDAKVLRKRLADIAVIVRPGT